MAFLGLLRRGRHERSGFALYGAAVAAARDPFFYARLDVPDTLDGRFDMVGLHVFLVIHRLQELGAPGAALAQAVFDAMFSDMDVNLRELGVGDLSVGKRVRAMWEAFHGRAAVYATALADPDPQALPAALARNVWRRPDAPAGPAGPDGAMDAAAAALARIVRAQAAALSGQDLASFAAGRIAFLAVEAAAAP